MNAGPSPPSLHAAAIDLGASSGRVALGRVGPDVLDVCVVHRFANTPVRAYGHLRWDLPALWDGVVTGLREAVRAATAEGGQLTSAGIDSWAVDYGLLDAEGRLLAHPVHYRDDRTDGVMERVREQLGDQHLYDVTGLQFLPFNTLYQLASEDPAQLARARTLLLVPDLLAHRLTGTVGAERSNASTTQLYDVRRHAWATDLAREVGLDPAILPPLHDPGSASGGLLAPLRDAVGDGGALRVVSVASHDTASAVAAVPTTDDRFAYISCGTWSLVGVELERPVLSRASLAANFTNEVGVDGTIRYLRNVTGLWPLQECLRHWSAAGEGADLEGLLAAAAVEPAGRHTVDLDAADLLAPGDMPARVAATCAAQGRPEPRTPAATVRCVLDSLAVGHARAVADAVALSGREVDTVHLVGGGSRNALLAQLTANACGLPVVAGPVEATAIGSLLVQARAAGVLADRWSARALVAATQPTAVHNPCVGAVP